MPRINRKSRRGNRRRAPNASMCVTKVQLHGRSIKLRPDPPSFISRPWNSVTLEFQTTGSGFVILNDMETILRAQVGIQGSGDLFQLELRIQKVRCWLPIEIGSDNPNINRLGVDFYDLHASQNTGDQRILCSKFDNAGKNHYAAVGFEWPDASKRAVAQTDGNTVFQVHVNGSPTTIIYADVLWRVNNPPEAVRKPALITSQFLPKLQPIINQEVVTDNSGPYGNDDESDLEAGLGCLFIQADRGILGCDDPCNLVGPPPLPPKTSVPGPRCIARSNNPAAGGSVLTLKDPTSNCTDRNGVLEDNFATCKDSQEERTD